MSGNIFASSTVPGIKDRDRDKQVIALYGQSYYLSRTSFTTAYWVKLMIGSTLLMLVAPIFLARLFFSAIQQPQPDATLFLANLFPPALRPANAFSLAEIPVSAVLTQALATADTTRSRGLLAHVLLELQNPELTIFAGPGYGVHLKDFNSGAYLEAFPDGKVPRCGLGGRYDEWGRVRGLRYAYRWIFTGEESSLTKSTDYGSGGDGVDVESLLMGWPALLLERAGVSDPLNPVPPGSSRNVYGEAVGRIVGKLCAGTRCEWGSVDSGSGEINSMSTDDIVKGEDTQERMIVQRKNDENLRQSQHALIGHAESAFILPPLLAAYAVAKQDTKWLIEAVQQIRARLSKTAVTSDERVSTYSTADATESSPEINGFNAQNERELRVENSVWICAGAVRVLTVLERWKPKFDTSVEEDEVRFQDWQKGATVELLETINTVLLQVRNENMNVEGMLQICADGTTSRSCTSSHQHPAMRALLVSSIYRLGQLNMLDDLGLLEWADKLYNAVAQYVDKDGKVSMVPVEADGEGWSFGGSESEGQSMVIMMWAARRDCEKVGMCKRHEQPSWWRRLIRLS